MAVNPTIFQTGQTVYYMSRNLPKTGRIIGTLSEGSSEKYFLEGEGEKIYVIGDSNFSNVNMFYETLDDLENALQNRQ